MSESVTSAPDLSVLDPSLMWTWVPDAAALPDVGAWAAAAAIGFFEDRGVTPSSEDLERMTASLAFLAEIPSLPAYDLRILFMVAPDLGGCLYHVALTDPTGVDDNMRRVLVGADRPAPMGDLFDSFTSEIGTGMSSTRFRLEDDTRLLPTGDRLEDRSVYGDHAVTVRRALTARGATDVTAATSTTDLAVLMASVAPIKALLLSPDLDELIEELSTEDPS